MKRRPLHLAPVTRPTTSSYVNDDPLDFNLLEEEEERTSLWQERAVTLWNPEHSPPRARLKKKPKRSRFRSGWEATFAAFCDALDVGWYYEPLRVYTGSSFYTPDFVVSTPLGCAFVELHASGRLRYVSDSRAESYLQKTRKIRQIQPQFPVLTGLPLVLLDETGMRSVQRQLAKITELTGAVKAATN